MDAELPREAGQEHAEGPEDSDEKRTIEKIIPSNDW